MSRETSSNQVPQAQHEIEMCRASRGVAATEGKPQDSPPQLRAECMAGEDDEEHWLRLVEERTAVLERRTKLVHKLVWGILCGGLLGALLGLAAGNPKFGIILGGVLGCALGRLWHDWDYRAH